MMIDNMMDLNIYQDGYTKEVQGPDSVAALVAVKAKSNRNASSPLEREFFNNFIEVFVCLVLV
jgi:hypothetical protein